MSDWSDLLRFGDEIAWLVGGGATLLGGGYKLGRWHETRSVRSVEVDPVDDAALQIDQLNDIMNAFSNDGSKVWDAKKGDFPKYNEWLKSEGAPIISFANLKGGVGKTTVAMNLAAHYASTGRDVLFLDLDWQGSASNVFNIALNAQSAESHINDLFVPDASGQLLLSLRESASSMVQGLDYISAYKTFSDIENTAFVTWLSGNTPFDIHYYLAQSLLDPEVRRKYDVIILDTPPRLTPALVNALCCSTHIIIPTKLDEFSVEAATFFLRTCTRFREDFNPRLRVAGVLGTMVRRISAAEDARASLKDGALKVGYKDILMRSHIPEQAAFSDVAGKDIAYLRKPPIRPFFTNLAEELGI